MAVRRWGVWGPRPLAPNVAALPLAGTPGHLILMGPGAGTAPQAFGGLLPATGATDVGGAQLHGGGGGLVLVGGAGDDLRIGGQDRDVLLGGMGAAYREADTGHDLVASADTDGGHRDLALRSLLSAWASGDDDLRGADGARQRSEGGPFFYTGTGQDEGSLGALGDGLGGGWLGADVGD